MPLSLSIFSAISRPVRPVLNPTLLYFANLPFRTRDTSILMPRKMKETIIMDGVILKEFLLVFTIITNLHPFRLMAFFQSFCHSFIFRLVPGSGGDAAYASMM